MTTLTNQRTRTKIADLPSWIPSVPPFPGEPTLDAPAHAASFLAALSSAVGSRDWTAFAALFAEQCWWKDSLTLTFDKRTIRGRDAIVRAWTALSETRRPGKFSGEKAAAREMEPALVRMGPELAVLEVPFGFENEAPKARCVGLAKLVPEDGGWKVWVLTTQVEELIDRPFGTLPRLGSRPSAIEASQRGRPEAQGLPRLKEGSVLDAVVVGGSCNGVANAIRLDSAGADCVVFETEGLAGGNWSRRRYEGLRLHHTKAMVSLPGFPAPEAFPEFLTGAQLTAYCCAAVRELGLPFFAGVEVVGSSWDEGRRVWEVRVREIETGRRGVVFARNLVVSTGWLTSHEHPKVPVMRDREVFAGPVMHTTAYRNSAPYKGRRVLVIGAGTSGHDVAASLARDGDVKGVTLLQRGKTLLVDAAPVMAVIAARYRGRMDVETADFLEFSFPTGVQRDLARAGFRAILAGVEGRTRALEGKGYVAEREPDPLARQLEERARGIYVDQPGTFGLVLEDKIKIERGEARGFTAEGVVVVCEGETGEGERERVVEADGVVYATGFGSYDLAAWWRETGFVDEGTAARVEDVGDLGVDEEGELIGVTTFSGHPNLYFAGFGIFTCRWTSRFVAVQILADVDGTFPESELKPLNIPEFIAMGSKALPKVEKATIAGSIEIPRILNGLWQLAGGHDQDIDVAAAAEAMKPLIDAGLYAFDMADHYGPAEQVIGRHNLTNPESNLPITAFTKWCPPETGDTSFSTAEAAVDLALGRMKQDRVALMQYHVWDYTDPTYLCNLAHLRTLQQRGKIAHIGLTNVDAAHLELLLDSGYEVVSNQVSCSVLDLRVLKGRMARVCEARGVGVLAYGTLLGGFLGEKWVGKTEPREEEGLNWSLRKYLRFIRAAGGWDAFQNVLRAVASVAAKHGVSIAAVAIRWVLDVPVVKAVIIGARLSGDSETYAASNLAAFAFSLDDEDRGLIAKAQAGLTDIPGDCGDEYRRPPFLTASGDLSDHVKESSAMQRVEEAVAKGQRVEFHSGSKWEPIAGYSRAVRFGNTIRVSGTTANPPPELRDQLGGVVGGKSARSQAVAALDIIEGAVRRLGGTMADVVRTRVMLRREEDVAGVSEAHGWVFNCHGIWPANTLTTAGLIGDEVLVEIEVEAVVGSGKSVVAIS
ncbi:endoribonuclease L-PSP [Colletotrichum karsti]|uniref:Endoribonuclease L-PSP n=1 Tax=Colletotrichum karsti TaxID=1095194 RepID=A0A9P6LJ96_9PEZI|nr:endoribonuclease L-PSP [Colletotrichum karsti]KAF9874996.1 endoribonuclease L-PSP [Colletotrichum karsti]